MKDELKVTANLNGLSYSKQILTLKFAQNHQLKDAATYSINNLPYSSTL